MSWTPIRFVDIIGQNGGRVWKGDGLRRYANYSNYPFYPEARQPARVFFMTSCGHIVCNDAGHNRELPSLTDCRSRKTRKSDVRCAAKEAKPTL